MDEKRLPSLRSGSNQSRQITASPRCHAVWRQQKSSMCPLSSFSQSFSSKLKVTCTYGHAGAKCSYGPHSAPEFTRRISEPCQNINLASAQAHFQDLGFKVCTGSRYLGGFIGEPDAVGEWLETQTTRWAELVHGLSSLAPKSPQTAYTALQRSVQAEWQFVQRTVRGTGPSFTDVDTAIVDSFLPALFGEDLADDDPRRDLCSLPVKHAGLALPAPSSTAEQNYNASLLTSGHLVAALRGSRQFRHSDHVDTIRSVRAELKRRTSAEHDKALDRILSRLPSAECRIIRRGKDTGRWLQVQPSVEHGTILSALEFRDSLLLRYGRTPHNLPSHCDGCNQQFSLRHSLECKKGGLVLARHNEIRDELQDLAARAFVPSAIRTEPKINLGCAAAATQASAAGPQSSRASTGAPDTADRGDILILAASDLICSHLKAFRDAPQRSLLLDLNRYDNVLELRYDNVLELDASKNPRLVLCDAVPRTTAEDADTAHCCDDEPSGGSHCEPCDDLQLTERLPNETDLACLTRRRHFAVNLNDDMNQDGELSCPSCLMNVPNANGEQTKQIEQLDRNAIGEPISRHHAYGDVLMTKSMPADEARKHDEDLTRWKGKDAMVQPPNQRGVSNDSGFGVWSR